MKIAIFILIIFSSLKSSSQIIDTSFYVVLKGIVLDSSVKKHNKLPTFIKKYVRLKSNDKFRISTKSFNSTDTRVGLKSRFSRLILYSFSSQWYFVFSYKHGGVGIHQHLIILRVAENNIITSHKNFIVNFHSNINEVLKTKTDFLEAFEW